ncbi:30S ribosome-binding factor RbfA [Longimicrobium sp.]|uniref:30S ribosome-binding factor RbfA n=1 Tax=Longimicrobium sp. TaxID=2029185 RepID=UPI002BE14D08|nr:30S ribosome-binding factor RbfA [Longimicrobium sp.]HSU13448.1 30S ribosome-binding factor RbfA [Longimicrobium sp.]
MPQYRRTDRLNEQLRQEITLLVRDEVRDPRVGLATITAVQTSPELDHAKVYFTTLGEEDERQEVLAGLRSAAPFLRRELGKRIHIRRVPELHFEIDRVLEEAQRIERLLHEALPREVPAPVDDEDDGETAGADAADSPSGDDETSGAGAADSPRAEN